MADDVLTMEPEGETAMTNGSGAPAIDIDEIRDLQADQVWTEFGDDRRCESEQDGKRCVLIQFHDSSVNATPHLYDLPEPVDPDTDDDDEDEDHTPTIDEVKAGLQNLAGGIATAQDVENAARAEEGLPPRDQELPLDFGPFNPDAALKAIFEKQAEIKTLQADYDEKKGWAKDAKDELDKANKALVAIIDSFKNRRQQALNPSQPYLREVSDAAPASTCPWERNHPGQTCPICSAAKASGIQQPAVESPVHPEHEQHEATAEGARVQNILEPLKAKLEAVNLFVEVGELQTLATDDLEALRSYADEPTTIPPQLFARTCLADAPGSLVQICRTCGISLKSETDNREDGGTWYPEGARVGFDCEGPSAQRHVDEPPVEATEAPEAESPRKPRSHARRKTDRKVAPEAERKAQTAEGRKRAVPKSASAKKAKQGKR